jgi:hypothetical protein
MGVRRRRSRVGDTADVAVARLKRGAHDVLDTVADAAEARVTAARRDLADRIDPAPVPRRGLRLLSLGLLVKTVSAVVWAVLERRSPQTTPQPTTLRGGPEHLPSTAPTDGADTDGEAAPTASDDEPVAGLTGDPEARGR